MLSKSKPTTIIRNFTNGAENMKDIYITFRVGESWKDVARRTDGP